MITLTWRDAVATATTLVVTFISFAAVRGWNVPILRSYRLSTLAIGVIGLATCIVAGSSSQANGLQGAYAITMASIGGLAFLLTIIGLISGSKVFLLATASAIVVLWVVATIRHISGSN